MQLALFDLDNTLLSGDSDYEWTQHLISKGILERDAFEQRNSEFFAQYKAGTLDIHESYWNRMHNIPYLFRSV